MSERTCETCMSKSGNWCRLHEFAPPKRVGFGCHQHMPKPPSKRERIIEVLERAIVHKGFLDIPHAADRILEIVKE